MLKYSSFTHAVHDEKGNVVEPIKAGATVFEVRERSQKLTDSYHASARGNKMFLERVKTPEGLHENIMEFGHEVTRNNIINSRILVEIEMKNLELVIGSSILEEFYGQENAVDEAKKTMNYLGLSEQIVQNLHPYWG